MTDIRFGCQTYSWQMTIDTYRGRLDHMAATAANAGFAGLEPEIVMLGNDWSGATLTSTLDRYGIALAALCFVQPWSGAVETDEEARAADSAIAAVAGIPGAILNLCQLPGTDRNDLAERQMHAIACVAAIAERAADRGVHCTFHPNSPAGSVFRTADDYDLLLDRLPDHIGFTPDLGHVVNGGMDPLELLMKYRDRVDHIHYKDIDVGGEWAETGAGTVDFVAVTDYLSRTGYHGWIVMEDESSRAERDPDGAAARNGDYVRTVLQ